MSDRLFLPQRGKYDNIILDNIENGNIIIDFVTGNILSQYVDLNGKRRVIGHRNKNSDVLFNFFDENSKSIKEFCVCRAIWIAKNGIIEQGKIVSHKDKNRLNNIIDNLYLTTPPKYYNPRIWTTKDVEWIKNNRESLTIPEMATYLGRSEKSIRHRIKALELPTKLKTREWTKAEEEIILKMYNNNCNIQDIASVLKRSIHSVRLRANRKLSIFRDNRLLRSTFKKCKNFYGSVKGSLVRKSSGCRCCLCDYNKYVELHHIDGNRKNNNINNIASLCPNHHTEITIGNEHKDKKLYCIWWRIYSDGTVSETFNNIDEISSL